ncbi:Acyl-protein thioesterase 1-like 1 [Symbiodinium microadriaticum]|uniref:Acyl-protein thioesterase 1-like 1 n=1 Tax=Symbiodinium microadriaticum TaxID=2951 RepID=A0A1Q9DUG9_SYMMI|nr:Acyl-protein thioesterase 1-like 1 [Symbiodinium microadriaticum]
MIDQHWEHWERTAPSQCSGRHPGQAWGNGKTRDWEVWPERSEEVQDWDNDMSQNWEEWAEASQEPIPDPRYIEAHDLALEPTGDHGFTMLLLHSCSGGPDDWIPIIHRLDVPFRNEIRFVVPCAPVRRETFDGWTKEQNSWFTYSEDGQHAEDPQELQEQLDRMEAILGKEVEKLPQKDARRLLVGGFSQGVALAVELGRRHGRSAVKAASPDTIGGPAGGLMPPAAAAIVTWCFQLRYNLSTVRTVEALVAPYASAAPAAPASATLAAPRVPDLYPASPRALAGLAVAVSP